jgi:hypothetical protein
MVGRKAGPRGHGSMNKKQQQKKDSGGRSNGKKVGPQLASSLLKELKGDGDHNRKQLKEEEDDSILPGDVYEYEEQLPEEEAGKNRRYDSVDQLDYELPSDFEVCFSLKYSCLLAF